MFQTTGEKLSLFSSLFSLCSSGFTVMNAGDMRKIQIIKSFAKIQELTPRKIVLMEQIHSMNVAVPDPLHLGEVEVLEECDGVVTREEGVLLVVRVADCVPVLYFDPTTGIIGASHNGWRGSEKNIIKRMIEKMVELGATRNEIKIAFGPAIGACCYTVDSDRYILFMEQMERFEKLIFKPHGAGFHLNLLRLNYELALEEGIARSNIDYLPFCTSCDSKRFYSYRRQHKKHPEQFGEMMGYIMR